MLRHCAAAVVALVLVTPAAQAEPQTVRVQLVRALAQAPYYIAVAKGYFAKEGITVESTDVRSALDAIAPLATGQLDVSVGAATAGFFNAAHQGFDLRVVAAMGYQGPVMATQPLIRKALWDAGTVRNAKDFRGRTVAVNAPGDITEYFLALMAKKYGMTLKDMNAVPLGFAEQLVAFKNGAIDAGFLPEPLSATAQMAGTAALDSDDVGIASGAITTFVFFGTKFMHDRRDAALDFLRALVLGARDAQGPYLKDPVISGSIAQQTGLKVEAVQASVPYAIDPDLDIAKFEDGLRQQEAVHREDGRLNYTGDLSFQNVIDASLVHEAAASLK
ncbi:MAG TPA: ABC transporter substrate-binding protein [Xanthobacteraceae bacterium]|nr:ABC transporter substrate-binding protein [Xanthobacteraceae bacterium]